MSPTAITVSSSEVIPQDVALRLQLAAMAGNEPVASLLELRWRRPGGPMLQEFWPVRAHKSIGERVRALASRGDVYVGAAPRVRQQGTKDAVHRGWALWTDLDEPDALDRLQAVTPAPSIVLLTGSPGHALAIWPLRSSLAPAHLVRANRRLAHALGGDMAATDAARILRVPQTANFKHDPPAAVECVRLELDVFEARDVVGELPDPPSPRPTVARSPRVIDTTSDALLALPATEYVPALLGRELGRDGKTTCPWHAGGAERTPSLHCFPDGRGWFCWPCDRGGTIIDFGALLYGIEPRGRGYHDIRRRLAADLLGSTRAAA